MFRVFICCLFYNTSALFSQNLYFDNQWKYSYPDSIQPKPRFAANLGIGRWYGNAELKNFQLGIRFINSSSNQLFSANANILPIPQYIKMRLGVATTRRLSSSLSCHLSYTLDQDRFQETNTQQNFHHLFVSLAHNNPSTRFSAGLFTHLASQSNYALDKKLYGVVEIAYRPGTKFAILGRVHSPNSLAIPMVETEIMHIPAKMWCYSIAISLPNAYFGCRINWTFKGAWDLDIRSRRHPVLGFAHQVLVHYNQP